MAGWLQEVRCEVAEVLGVEPVEVELRPTAEAFPGQSSHLLLHH